MVGNRHFSRILEAGHRSDIGRYDLLSFTGLPGLRRGIIVDCFQIEGKVQVDIEKLKIFVR